MEQDENIHCRLRLRDYFAPSEIRIVAAPLSLERKPRTHCGQSTPPSPEEQGLARLAILSQTKDGVTRDRVPLTVTGISSDCVRQPLRSPCEPERHRMGFSRSSSRLLCDCETGLKSALSCIRSGSISTRSSILLVNSRIQFEPQCNLRGASSGLGQGVRNRL